MMVDIVHTYDGSYFIARNNVGLTEGIALKNPTMAHPQDGFRGKRDKEKKYE